MLIQFSLTNYRNFKNTAVLDLSEAKITEFPEHLYHSDDNMGILPMTAIYGPNGSGKSNFLKGLWDLRNLILDAPSVKNLHPCFCFDPESKKNPVEFDILFRIDTREYEYQLKLTDKIVLEENLFGRNLTDNTFDVLIDRDSDGVFLCEAWEQTDVSKLDDNVPLLYFLGVSKNELEITSIIRFFRNIVFFSGHQIKRELLDTVIKSRTLKSRLLSHLPALDLDITNIRLSGENIILTHSYQNHHVDLNWEDESAGTRQLLSLLACIIHAMENHTLILADDPETHLHPKAVNYLYRLFTAPKTESEGAQLITVTHENSNMNNSLFRRDELWLVSKNEEGASSLYTLALFLKENGEKVRKDETYFKQYLEGRYGAIPTITLTRKQL